jgi:ABC transport system ATP-binding/permease protein
MYTRYSIGRSQECDLVLDNAFISRIHAYIEKRDDGIWLIDNNSSNGTFVNDVDDQVIGERLVQGGDIVFLTIYHQVPLDLLWKQACQSGDVTLAGGTFQPKQKVVRIGRASDNDILLEELRVSRFHAELEQVSLGTWIIRDLSGKVGLWVNDEWVCGKDLPLHPGDRIEIAGMEISVQFAEGKSGSLVVGAIRKGFYVQTRGLTIDRSGFFSRQERLINELSLTVFPGEFVALVGPSGAGKTALVRALSGCSRQMAGQVLFNGLDLLQHLGRFSPQIGYLPQGTTLHPGLTIQETLCFNARLKSLPDVSDSEILERARHVCSELGLDKVMDSRIGSANLSGAEVKLVSIAGELITEPKALFLDEPIAGLSSKDASNFCTILRRLANSRGIAIIISVSEPCVETYHLLDQVVCLNSGRLCYYGPAYPESIIFLMPDDIDPEQEDADSVVEILENGDALGMERDYLKSFYYTEYVERREKQVAAEQGKLSAGISNARRIHPLQQFRVLLKRCFLPRVRDVSGLSMQLIFPLVAGFLIGWGLQGQWINLSVFLIILTTIWLGAHGSMQDVLVDFPAFCRERRTGISPTAYFFSKFLCNATITFLQCVLLLALSCPFLGLLGVAPLLLFVCWGSSITGVVIGLLLGTFFKEKYLATNALRIAMILFLVLGNLLRPYDNLDVSTREPMGCVPVRWGYDTASFVVDAKYGDNFKNPILENRFTLLKPLYKMSPLYEVRKEKGFGWDEFLFASAYVVFAITILYILFYLRVMLVRQ